MSDPIPSAGLHSITRVRHDMRRRVLTVASVEQLTPKMRRIIFASPDLADFNSLGADDHIKILLPGASENDRVMRDYTPRAFDRQAQTLAIDFVLHDAGPATAWAMAAKVGDELRIGGPKGSMVVTDDFDWYLLIGDETALPAIGRRLEELRAGVPVISVVAIDTMADAQIVTTKAAWNARWACREVEGADDAASLKTVLSGLTLPAGDGYVWIAAEARVAKALRAYVTENLGHPANWMRASGYWLSGEPGAHENLG